MDTAGDRPEVLFCDLGTGPNGRHSVTAVAEAGYVRSLLELGSYRPLAG